MNLYLGPPYVLKSPAMKSLDNPKESLDTQQKTHMLKTIYTEKVEKITERIFRMIKKRVRTNNTKLNL